MLDLDFITANPEAVRRAIEIKGVDLDLDELLRAYESLKATLQEVEALRAERNRLSKLTGSAASEERQRFIDQSRQCGGGLGELDPGLREKERRLRELLLRVPNIPADDEPVGEGEEQNVEHHAWGEPPRFSFRPRDHVELVELNDWAHLAGGSPPPPPPPRAGPPPRPPPPPPPPASRSAPAARRAPPAATSAASS